MQANFDARAAAAGTPPSPMERRQPEARKDRWMQELERAAMAESAAARTAPRAAEVRVPEASAVQDAAPARHGASATAAQRTGRAHGGSGHGAAHFGAGTRVAAQWDAPPASSAAASTANGSMAAASAQHRAAARAGADPLQPAAAAAQQVAAAAPALMAGTPSAVLQLGPASAAMLDAEAAPDAPLPERPAPDLPPDGEAYARSRFHLVQAEDGVHAWLRDASLSQAQARRVASAMAGELALAGSPLAALTVNGRRILSPGASGDQPGRRAADLPGEAAVPPLPPVAFKGA